MTQAITLPLWIFIVLLALALLAVLDYANSIDLCKQLDVPLIQAGRI